MLVEGVYNLLTTNVALTAMVSDRVFALIIPKNPIVPAVTFYVVSNRTEVNLDRSAISFDSIEINVWAKTYLSAKSGQDILHTLLDAYKGTLSDGTRVLMVSSNDIPDFYEKDSLLFRSGTTFVFSNS